MIRPTVARVDLAAIESNLLAIAQFLSGARTSHLEPRASDLDAPRSTHPDAPRTPHPAPRIIAVVKANAYGHGAADVALALERAGAAMLACADIEEGIVLRRAGVRAPILVFGALGISDLDGVFEYDLTPTISTPTAAQNLEAAARHRLGSDTGQPRVRPGSDPGLTPPRRAKLRCHLKIDTGMNRLGFRHDNLGRTLPAIANSEYLAIDAVYTHFATADEPEHPAFALQRERFEHVLATLPSLGIHPQWRHAANSAALLRDERVWYDFVRPGLLLYGIVPPPLAATIALRPALSLHSRIVHVKGLRPGEGTGYGLRSVADSPRTIAVVPAGYADGLDRRMAGHAFMLVRGKRVPVVGSVCMDMTMIDVTGMEVSTGDEVVIVGRQGGEEIGMREIAAAIGTIPYELLCRVGTRIERIYD
ncbi:MAG TPA: alanine racemase [Vicinamibacterales bacterium]|nr:alanine racemase [Vicinamibacterales bacterium]